MWTLERESMQEAQQYLRIITEEWGAALNRLKAFVEE
jgi:hypothetical protein